MGTVQKLKDTRFGGDAPILFIDDILTNGSLLLNEYGHPFGKTKSFAKDTVVKNYAKATTLLNSDNIHSKITANGGWTQYIVPEIANDGHLKITSTQAGDTLTATGTYDYGITVSDDIQQYLLNNKTHQFYISLWHKPTKKITTTKKRPFALFTRLDSNYFYTFDNTEIFELPSSSGNRLGYFKDSSTISNNVTFRSIGTKDFTTGFGDFNSFQKACVFYLGLNASWASGSGQNGEIFIPHDFYRAYIEDLTVSGRSYDEVKQIDYKMYIEAFSQGGRYFQG